MKKLAMAIVALIGVSLAAAASPILFQDDFEGESGTNLVAEVGVWQHWLVPANGDGIISATGPYGTATNVLKMVRPANQNAQTSARAWLTNGAWSTGDISYSPTGGAIVVNMDIKYMTSGAGMEAALNVVLGSDLAGFQQKTLLSGTPYHPNTPLQDGNCITPCVTATAMCGTIMRGSAPRATASWPPPDRMSRPRRTR